jgi:hypothetical protein
MMDRELKWISNIYDPSRDDMAEHVIPEGDESREEAVYWYLFWLVDKVIDEPVATKHYSVDELKAMNYVGVYKVVAS